MTHFSERGSDAAVMELATKADRRRPDRLAHVSPELVPLLRGEYVPTSEPDNRFGDPEQLGAARGLLVGVALSVPLWVMLALVGRWILHEV